MNHGLLQCVGFWILLFSVDRDLAATAHQAGCSCGGRLHRADYLRKPRGGPKGMCREHGYRLSFCCGREGCLLDISFGRMALRRVPAVEGRRRGFGLKRLPGSVYILGPAGAFFQAACFNSHCSALFTFRGHCLPRFEDLRGFRGRCLLSRLREPRQFSHRNLALEPPSQWNCYIPET